jgi:hypothetical protein
VHRGEDSEMGVANTASAGEPGATFTYFVHLFTFNISHWNLHITATPPPSNRPQPPPTQMSQPPFRAWSRGIACGAIGFYPPTRGGRDGTENHSITLPPEDPSAESACCECGPGPYEVYTVYQVFTSPSSGRLPWGYIAPCHHHQATRPPCPSISSPRR